MKTKIIISIFSFLALLFIWSCEEDLLTTNETPVEVRMGNGNGNSGNNGNGNGNPGNPGGTNTDDIVYSLSYLGIVTNQTAYALETSNNKKRESMGVGECGGPFVLSGISNLPDPNMFGCYSSVCVAFHGVSQFDKKNVPGRAKATFVFYNDPVCSSQTTQVQLNIVGDIQPFPSGQISLFPTATNPIVTIDFDGWWVEGCPESGCVAGGQGPDLRIPFEPEDQSLTITIASGACSDLTPCTP